MTTDHLSDEQLSAHLDGEAPEVSDHIGGCGDCRARLAELRAVAALVAAPPPPPDPEARDDAVARALAPEATRTVAPRRLAMIAVAAAVLVAAGIATPLLTRSGSKHTTAALSRKSATDSAREAATGTASAEANPIDGGDLGAQSDAGTLGTIVSSALDPRASSDQFGAGSGSVAGSTAGGPASQAAPQTTSCTPPAGGQVVYRARLRWNGTPAHVFAIEPGRRLVVMAQAGCQVLVDRNF